MESKEKITSRISMYGGISLVMAGMNRLGMPALFDQTLGKRPNQAHYSFSDVFLGWMYCNLCGAKRVEDIKTEGLYGTLNEIPIARLCSPDQISRIFRRFATPIEKHINRDSKIEHEFNRNPLMNDLLLEFCKRLRLLDESTPYLIDFDGTTIPTEKFDSKLTYKGFRGYSPAVSMINKIPVSIEARNGNTSPSYKIKQALEELFLRLDKAKIQAWGIRMDAASYQQEIIYYLDRLNKKFFIRVPNTEDNLDDFKIAPWKAVNIHGRVEEIASVEFYPFDESHKFRYVVSRFETGEIIDNQKQYVYRAIVTNQMDKASGSSDFIMSDLDVVHLYDQRGDSENNFRDLLNDFNWKRVPFGDMNSNLVFMYISAMAKCMYEYVINQLSAYTPELQENFKLKKFVAYFVRPLSVEWNKTGADWKPDLLNMRERFDGIKKWAVRE